jgi:hypothetical protein
VGWTVPPDPETTGVEYKFWPFEAPVTATVSPILSCRSSSDSISMSGGDLGVIRFFQAKH